MSRRKKAEVLEEDAPAVSEPISNPVITDEVSVPITDDSNEEAPAPDPKKEPEKKHEPTFDTVLVRHDLDNAEIAALAKLQNRTRIKYAMKEQELNSIKNDFKSQLEKLECEINRIQSIILDGFEMQPVNAVVLLHMDTATRTVEKVFYRQSDGTFIKTELADSACELDLFCMLPRGHIIEDPIPEAFRKIP